jgi:hypothetical protein
MTTKMLEVTVHKGLDGMFVQVKDHEGHENLFLERGNYDNPYAALNNVLKRYY